MVSIIGAIAAFVMKFGSIVAIDVIGAIKIKLNAIGTNGAPLYLSPLHIGAISICAIVVDDAITPLDPLALMDPGSPSTLLAPLSPLAQFVPLSQMNRPCSYRQWCH